MNPIGKQYNALTGAELKAVILREVERELDNTGINSVGVTYPLVSWGWKLLICQKDSAGGIKSDTPERSVTAGAPIEELKAQVEESPAHKVLRALQGGSKRFGQQPPAPSKVREAEKLPEPEA